MTGSGCRRLYDCAAVSRTVAIIAVVVVLRLLLLVNVFRLFGGFIAYDSANREDKRCGVREEEKLF